MNQRIESYSVPSSTSSPRSSTSTDRLVLSEEELFAMTVAIGPPQRELRSLPRVSYKSTTVTRSFRGPQCSTRYQPFAEFKYFPLLPTEIRLKIWHLSVEPRFVGFKYDIGRFLFPKLLHVNSESRHEALTKIWPQHPTAPNLFDEARHGLIYSPKIDTLFLDDTSFPRSEWYHKNVFHTITCMKHTEFVYEVQKVVISLDAIHDIWFQDCMHCFLLANLPRVFPELKELSILLRMGPLGTDVSDLWEVADGDWQWENFWGRNVVADFKRNWARCVAARPNYFGKITLRFVRLEHWVR